MNTEESVFSFYENGIKNTTPSKQININDFIELLKQENNLIEKVRQEPDKDKRQKQKSKLSYVTFAGTFNKREKAGLKKASGLACFDFDDIKNLNEVKEKLIKNKYTHLLFVSPSGNGFKVVVKIPEVKDDDEYKKYWISIARHFDLNENDEASKDISRACYISTDKEPYFNPNSEIYTEQVEDTSIIPIAISNTNKKRDTSRSGLEYRRLIALFRSGKTRQEAIKEMQAYAKWVTSPEQYRQHQLDAAESFVLTEQENKQTKNVELAKETLKILKDPNLFELIIQELNKTIEGEQKSKKAITLSLCSVWVDGCEVPLNTLVSSESSAGKSYICKKIIKLFPKEMVIYRTKITPEAFTYWHNEPEWDWDGKICYLEDISQGILDAPSFKVMCSEGSTATIVNKQKAIDIEIRGKPVMLITTARTSPNTEILNRFQIVSLDESSQQTERIIFRQAKQSNDEKYNPDIISALSCLKRKVVFIPYAEKIAQYIKDSFNFGSLRLRRDFSRLLDLIRCSAVLHQFQRSINERDEIIADEQDYIIARECINYIQTQTFKGLTHKLKKAFDCCEALVEFSAKDIHNKFPFVNQKMWYNYLDDLCERGMLITELRKVEESKSRVTYYKINKAGSFTLPEFKSLPDFFTNVTIDTINTNDTNVTNDKNDCKKCNDYIDFPQDNELIKPSKVMQV